MSKIYTKKGDRGTTSLASGKIVAKNSPEIEFLGCIDELTSFLGLAAEALSNQSELIKKIRRIQRELFALTTQVATDKQFIFEIQNIELLEKEIDEISKILPPLKFFILPSGGEGSARLHVTRAICRRSERMALQLNLTPEIREIIITYLNRLSDWLYIVARYAAFLLKIKEINL